MSGLLALLDDVVAIAKVAAATIDDTVGQAAKVGAKAAGVVIDDAAVTPRYVTGFAAKRELPIVGRIAVGSLKNKLLFLLPAALLLSLYLPQAITPLLMIGGLYLAYEGFEKVLHWITGDAPSKNPVQAVAALDDKTLEDQRVSGAIRTDFILSAEIIVIALGTVSEAPFAKQLLALCVIAALMTVGVYGLVAAIVKLDDAGVALQKSTNSAYRTLGALILRGAPYLMKGLALAGTAAMFLVGGGILTHGFPKFEARINAYAKGAGAFGSVLPTLADALVGILAGALILVLVTTAKRLFGGAKKADASA